MRGDIQFAKIDVKKHSRPKQTVLVFFGFLLLSILSIFSVLSVRAYFTATGTKSGELSFGEIAVALVGTSDGDNEITVTKNNFKTKYLNNVAPGSTLNFNDIKVKNVGDFSEYVLINVDVKITPKSGTALNYNEWYNIDGYKVNNHDFSINSAEASLLAVGESKTANIKWTIPGEVVGNTYKQSSVSVKVTAYGTQTNLPEAKAYQDKELYASYFICRHAPEIAETTPSKNLFDANTLLESRNYQYTVATDSFVTTSRSDTSGWATHTPIQLKANTVYTISTTNLTDIDVWTYTGLKRIKRAKATSVTFTSPADGLISAKFFSPESTYPYEIGYIQVEEGTVATAYTPYSEPATYSGATAVNDPLRVVNNGKNLLNPNAELVETPNVSYLGVSLDVNKVYSLKITLKEGKSVPSNMAFGYVYKETETTSASAIWLLSSSGGMIRSFTTTYSQSVQPTVSAGIAVYPKSQATWDAIMDAFNVMLVEGVYTESTMPTFEEYVGVQDTMDFTNQTITRNVGKVEFTGDENWVRYNYGNEGISFYFSGLTLKDNGYKTSTCSHFTNIIGAWGTNFKNDQGIYSDHPDTVNLYFRAPNGRADIDTVEEWKAWLKQQYNSGHPVTVWYKQKTPVTEKFFASKNLYDGEQWLHYEEGASDNNTEVSGKILITQGATKDLNKQVMELGGDVFEYVKNKPITISCKIKIYPDDTRTNNRIAISYKENADEAASFIARESTRNTIPKDGEWHYYWVTVDAFASLKSSTTKGQITLWFADYTATGEHGHFEITDLQFEVGSVPTQFENYDQTVYARVNDVELRQINSSKDTYDASTKTITRRVAKTELKTNIDYYIYTNEDTNYLTAYTNDSQLSKFASVPVTKGNSHTILCSHLPYRYSSVGYLKRTDEGIMGWNDATASFMMTFSVSRFDANVNSFKAWVEQQAYQGKPVTVWYEVQTPTTETLS
jgi:hypothetical protein